MDNEAYWGDRLNTYSEKDWATKPSVFIQQAFPYFPPAAKVLELGGGHGQDSIWLAEQGCNVTYTDLVSEVVEKVRQRTAAMQNLTCLTSDVSKGLQFPAENFDVVHSHLGLHYFGHDQTRLILEDIHRILKTRGIISLLLNTIDDPEIAEDGYTRLEPHYYQDPSGMKKSYYSVDYLRELIDGLFEPLLLDTNGETHKDEIKTLVRFIGEKR